MIILASASPRRIEMLRNAGYDPVVKPASIIEKLPFEMSPETATMFLALSKGFAAAGEFTSGLQTFCDDKDPDGITLIAADTVVVYDGDIIGKPADENEAYRILKRLRGTSHHVITGCCIIKMPGVCHADPNKADGAAAHRINCTPRKAYCFYEDTEVFFKDYSDEELRAYVQTDEPYDKAGGYAIQETFKKYVDHIEGDFDNVVGLPLARVKPYLVL